MAKRADPALATAAALELVAGTIGGKIAAGSRLRGTVVTGASGDLEVEITMVVRRKPTVEARIDHLTQAMILFVVEPWRGERCQHYIKGRRRGGGWASSGQCRNTPTHVSAFRAFDNTTAYSFCCATHSKHEIGPNVFALIKIPTVRLLTARQEIKNRAELKARLEKMSPEERIAEDARSLKRTTEATEILMDVDAAAIAARLGATKEALTPDGVASLEKIVSALTTEELDGLARVVAATIESERSTG